MWALYWMEPSLTPAVIATIPSPSSSVKVRPLAVLLPPYNALISCYASYPLYFHARMFAGQVIKGWDVGLASMAKGEKALLTCKPEFAYGAHGSPPKIPPDSTLNFEVELLRWQSSNDVSGDGGVIKKVLVEPSEMRGPGQNDEAQSEWRGGDWVCRARDSPPSSHSYSHLPHMMLSRVFHAPWIIDRPLDPHAAAAS